MRNETDILDQREITLTTSTWRSQWLFSSLVRFDSDTNTIGGITGE